MLRVCPHWTSNPGSAPCSRCLMCTQSSGEQQDPITDSGLCNPVYSQRRHIMTSDSLHYLLTSVTLPPWGRGELLMRNPHGLSVVSYHRPWVLDIFSKYAPWRWLIGLAWFAKLSCQTSYHFPVLKYDIKQECCQTWAARLALYWTFNTSVDELPVDLFIDRFWLYWSENYENPYLLW